MYTRKTPKQAAADAKAKVESALAQIAASVEALASSDDWQAMLKSMAKFHHYSFSNMMLIASQRPGTKMVAGFNAWKDAGRWVKKGAKGIMILAPRTYTKQEVVKSTDPDTGKEVRATEQRQGIYFRPTYVFAIEDTEGEPLATVHDFARPLEGQNEVASAAMVDIGVWLEEHGVTLSYEEMPDPDVGGFYSAEERKIALNKDRQPLHQLKTLVHELAHLLLHTPRELQKLEFQAKHGTLDVSRDTKEVEAESVAYVVCSAIGVDSAQYSFGYVASWARGQPGLVAKVASRVQAAASMLLSEVLEVDAPDEQREVQEAVGESRELIVAEEGEPRENPGDHSLPAYYGYVMDPAIYALSGGEWQALPEQTPASESDEQPAAEPEGAEESGELQRKIEDVARQIEVSSSRVNKDLGQWQTSTDDRGNSVYTWPTPDGRRYVVIPGCTEGVDVDCPWVVMVQDDDSFVWIDWFGRPSAADGDIKFVTPQAAAAAAASHHAAHRGMDVDDQATRELAEAIDEGMSRTVHVANWVTKEGMYGRHPSMKEAFDTASDTSKWARKQGAWLAKKIEMMNGSSLARLYGREIPEQLRGHPGQGPDVFGFALAMEAMDLGVRWSDNHPQTKVKVPVLGMQPGELLLVCNSASCRPKSL